LHTYIWSQLVYEHKFNYLESVDVTSLLVQFRLEYDTHTGEYYQSDV